MEVGIYLTDAHMAQCLGGFRPRDHLLHTRAGMAVIICEWSLSNRVGKSVLLSAPSKRPGQSTEATGMGWPSLAKVAPAYKHGFGARMPGAKAREAGSA